MMKKKTKEKIEIKKKEEKVEVVGMVTGAIKDRDFILKIGPFGSDCAVWCNGKLLEYVQKVEISLSTDKPTTMTIHRVLI